MINYCPLNNWSRGVAVQHAALSRPRSRVRIPSGPPKLVQKTNQKSWFFCYFMPVFVTKVGLFLCYAPRGRKTVFCIGAAIRHIGSCQGRNIDSILHAYELTLSISRNIECLPKDILLLTKLRSPQIRMKVAS